MPGIRNRNITEEDIAKFIQLRKKFSVLEIAEKTGFCREAIYKACRRKGKPLREVNDGYRRPSKLPIQSKPSFTRPAAVYSNASYLDTFQKYAS